MTDANRQLIATTFKAMQGQVTSIFLQAHIPVADAEDLTQEVFLKMMGLDILLPDQINALAVRIAFQKRIDWLRHRAIVKEKLSKWSQETTVPSGQQLLEVKQLRQMESQIVSRMKDKDIRVYELSRFEDKSVDEIAVIAGMSRRAVEGRLYRVRRKVRSELAAV